MLIANYHTHTPRCFHARGTEEEYVQAAKAAGIRILGFSDHAPQWFPGDYYSGMRMYPNQLPEYCDSVRNMQKQYAGQMEILLGVEAEYYPQIFGTLLENLRDQGVAYMILGQHWPGCEMDQPYAGRATADTDYLRRHCHQVMEAINTGCFTYIAHPDIVNFRGDDKTYEEQIRPLCREAKSCGIPLEINLLGLNEGRHYPDPRFWRIAAEENCSCVIGFDAHTPEALKNTAVYTRAREMANKLGLTLLDTVSLRSLI